MPLMNERVLLEQLQYNLWKLENLGTSFILHFQKWSLKSIFNLPQVVYQPSCTLHFYFRTISFTSHPRAAAAVLCTVYHCQCVLSSILVDTAPWVSVPRCVIVFLCVFPQQNKLTYLCNLCIFKRCENWFY